MALKTKPRWDKYDGYIGNFRGVLAEDIDLIAEANVVLAVGANSTGAVVIGSGQTGIIGLMIVPVGADIHGNLLDGGVNNQAGDRCDVGVHGEITNFHPYDASSPGSSPAPEAGTVYYGHPNGSVLKTSGPGCLYVGHTLEADRLIVHVNAAADAAS